MKRRVNEMFCWRLKFVETKALIALGYYWCQTGFWLPFGFVTFAVWPWRLFLCPSSLVLQILLKTSICWISSLRFVFQSQPVPVCLVPVGLYLAMCQYVPRTCPNSSKQLLVGNAKEGSPEQDCLEGSYEILVFLMWKINGGFRYAEELECKQFCLLS